MKFKSLTPVDRALEIFLDHITPVKRVEDVPLRNAPGRILARPIIADSDVPSYRRAAMDGWAVRAEDTDGASSSSPLTLRIGDDVTPGVVVRVHTGSKMPSDADAVVMVEDTERVDEMVEIRAQVHPFENVGAQGEDVKKGERVLDTGHALRPADIGLLASLGLTSAVVYEKPVVAVLPTGEELVSSRPSAGEIIETNGLMNSLLVEQWGAQSRYRHFIPDDSELIKAALQSDLDADLIITTGGTSVGQRDLVPQAVSALGRVLVHGIAMSPGKPTALGVIGSTPVVCLPGFPVANLVASFVFTRPAVHCLAHRSPVTARPIQGRLARKLVGKPGSRAYARVALKEGKVYPIMVSGSGILSSLAKADGLVIIPENVEGYDEGTIVEVTPLE
ncbi:MAG: molybdopterin molybdotransferase MoeA [Halobacteriota archaeon]